MGLTIYISKTDGDLLNSNVEKSGPMWKGTIQRAMWQGLEEEQLKIEDNPGYKYRPISYINFIPAIPGEYIEIGDYNFEIIDLKGHTPGMVGLYEKNIKYYFAEIIFWERLLPILHFGDLNMVIC